MISGFGNLVALFAVRKVAYDFTSHSFNIATRHAAGLAVQPGMGILSKRRLRLDPFDRADFVAAGTSLTIPTLNCPKPF